MKLAIIGAGLAGLTFGALAAKDGHEVTVFDKNAKPGGVVALLEHEGYGFEQGPLLLGDLWEGEPVYEFLKSLDIRIRKNLTKFYGQLLQHNPFIIYC